MFPAFPEKVFGRHNLGNLTNIILTIYIAIYVSTYVMSMSYGNVYGAPLYCDDVNII